MIASSFYAGLRGVRRRPGLVVLLYAMNLVLAFVLALPLLTMLRNEVGPTGFGPELAGQFDLVIWADFADALGTAFGAMAAQLFWMIPLYLVWKAAAAVGLIHALRGDHIRSFWQGVGRYTGRAVLLALAFVVPLGIAAVALVVGALILSAVWKGEVGTFWTYLVIAPTLFISVLAVLDLMHDYARIALVVDEKPVWTAVITGVKWPFQHGQASWLYLAWFVPAALLLVLPTVLDMSMTAATAAVIWGLFLLQQVVLLLRAAVTVGWIGSEVALYETVWFIEAPLIAARSEQEAPLVADAVPGPEQPGLASA